MHLAKYWSPGKEERVHCGLCPRGCVIPEGGVGFCRVRQNQLGQLYTLNYGKFTALAMDPIEKKPLYHFYPGSKILSIGSFGCTFRCQFCQNWQIAQVSSDGETITPEKLAQLAQNGVDQGSIGVAYTYSEPLAWYEFVLAAAKAVRGMGLKNVLVTNGYIQPEPYAELLPLIDAVNMDVKGFTESFYQKIVGGRLAPVLAAAEQTVRAGKHLEITTLLIPGENDSAEELTALVDWIADKLGPQVPLHLSRYFPNYQMSLPPTPLSSMKQAESIAQRKLKHVYLGNV